MMNSKDGTKWVFSFHFDFVMYSIYLLNVIWWWFYFYAELCVLPQWTVTHHSGTCDFHSLVDTRCECLCVESYQLNSLMKEKPVFSVKTKLTSLDSLRTTASHCDNWLIFFLLLFSIESVINWAHIELTVLGVFLLIRVRWVIEKK